MKIVAYTHLHRLQQPTGVGRHIRHMLLGLHGTPGVELSIVTPKIEPRPELAALGLPIVPVQELPLGVSPMQWAWGFLDRPYVERWSGPVDWVYCPAESYVPARTARLAVTVQDVHAFEQHLPWSNTWKYRVSRLRWRILFRKIQHADLVVAGSEYTRSRLLDLFSITPEKIHVIGNGVDEQFFLNHAEAAERSGTDPYLLVVGGLTRRKGGDRVLRVARELRNRGLSIRIRVTGASQPEFTQQVSEHPDVQLLGYVSDAVLADLMRGSLALLFLSRYEGFGIPALEAMAAGTPVVVSSCPALVETVGSAGIVVDADNTDAVTEMVLHLLQNEEMRQRYVARGKQRAQSFTWSRCVSRLVAAMKAVEQLS